MKKTMNRKGFTLIEMMIVIAIIAVLVAVIVPTVTGSTDKAAAATNAANLRGVEGEIVSMMLLEPDAFGDHSKEQAEIDRKENIYQFGDDVLEAAQAALVAATTDLDSAKKDLDDYKKTDEYLDAVAAQKALEDEINPEIEKYQSERAKYVANKDHTGCVKSDYIGYKSHNTYCYYDNLKKVGELDLKIAALKAKKEVNEGLLEPLNKVKLKEADIAIKQTTYNNCQTAVDLAKQANQNALDGLAAQEQALYELKAVNGVITLDNGTTIQAPVSKKVNKDAVNVDKDVEMVVYVNTTTYEAYAYYKGDKMYQSSDFAAVAGNED